MITPTGTGARIGVTAVAALTVLSLAACGAPLGRSGGATDPVALRAAWGQNATGVGGDVLRSIIASGISPEFSITPISKNQAPGDDYEGTALKKLMAGSADLTVVRSDRIVTAGADSLAALSAPNVVTNESQAAAIAADPKVNELATGDLAKLGLVSLGIVPGGLRHPFGYGTTALLGASDYANGTFNTRVGAAGDAVVQALGGTTDHSIESTRSAEVESGALRGIEVSLQQYGAADRPAVLTSNVTLYAKFDVILIRKKVYDAMSEEQRKSLRTRTSRATAATLVGRQTDTAAFGSWCNETGASAVHASDEQVASVTSALDAVTKRLSASPTGSALVARMRALRDGTTGVPLGTCTAATRPDAEYRVEPTGDQTVLDGTWRVDTKQEDLVDAGATPAYASGNAGIWTLKIKKGVAEVTQASGPPCSTQFTFDGDRVSMDWSINGDTDCGGLMIGTYRRDGDTVHFIWTGERDYPVAWDNAWTKHGMVKVG